MKATVLPLGLCILMTGIVNGAEPLKINSEEPVAFQFYGDRPFGYPIPTIVHPDTPFDPEKGFGFEPDSVAGEHTFSVAVEEGTYEVTVPIGTSKTPAAFTIWSESRQLIRGPFLAKESETTFTTFTVNVRTPELTPPPPHAPGAEAVELNPRERSLRRWDHKLSFTIQGDINLVDTVMIRARLPRPFHPPTLYLLGDSTVTDQQGGDYASWGQMMPRMFNEMVAVANHAESGETMKSFLFSNRLNKVLSTLQAGDTVLIQFGHNDSKSQWPQTYAEPHSTYPAYLHAYIAEIRLRGATPVLVTSPERRNFTADGHIKLTHGDYPAAVRAVAASEHVALIDLNLTSIALYEALGPQRAPLAFANHGKDGTHHNAYGAYQLALAVAHGLRGAGVPIASHLAADLPDFDPTHPVLPADFPLTLPDIRPVEAPRGN